uniref:C3H1-type domain-containing protein n=1 Tax=Chromera velia CCMP2878 TaxID=1169474 RepID=A0A0G4HVD4_9ALVE|eukprot:Cvel_8834.t1-p1 / transcript=Cvel_8834.t1 / gene=Cvel_8834 / organism=Chromera_velia_CCMP2878 / gene_product=hypothetical protein / transcript_product=hypothetical protein / location=Cvel_scaffold495:74509-79800(+) / protein_length=1022 / sequence_SO=supercontig / SO=protein_coding / is_pseudo=false
MTDSAAGLGASAPPSTKPYRMEMCIYFQEGRCPKGDNCVFAHGEKELQPPPSLTRRKTSLCMNFQKGVCPLATEDCEFAHGKEDLSLEIFNVLPKSKISLCRPWMIKGSCSLGDACLNAHGTEELKPRKYRWADIEKRAKKEEVEMGSALEECIARLEAGQTPAKIRLGPLTWVALEKKKRTVAVSPQLEGRGDGGDSGRDPTASTQTTTGGPTEAGKGGAAGEGKKQPEESAGGVEGHKGETQKEEKQKERGDKDSSAGSHETEPDPFPVWLVHHESTRSYLQSLDMGLLLFVRSDFLLHQRLAAEKLKEGGKEGKEKAKEKKKPEERNVEQGEGKKELPQEQPKNQLRLASVHETANLESEEDSMSRAKQKKKNKTEKGSAQTNNSSNDTGTQAKSTPAPTLPTGPHDTNRAEKQQQQQPRPNSFGPSLAASLTPRTRSEARVSEPPSTHAARPRPEILPRPPPSPSPSPSYVPPSRNAHPPPAPNGFQPPLPASDYPYPLPEHQGLPPRPSELNAKRPGAPFVPDQTLQPQTTRPSFPLDPPARPPFRLSLSNRSSLAQLGHPPFPFPFLHPNGTPVVDSRFVPTHSHRLTHVPVSAAAVAPTPPPANGTNRDNPCLTHPDTLPVSVSPGPEDRKKAAEGNRDGTRESVVAAGEGQKRSLISNADANQIGLAVSSSSPIQPASGPRGPPCPPTAVSPQEADANAMLSALQATPAYGPPPKSTTNSLLSIQPQAVSSHLQQPASHTAPEPLAGRQIGGDEQPVQDRVREPEGRGESENKSGSGGLTGTTAATPRREMQIDSQIQNHQERNIKKSKKSNNKHPMQTSPSVREVVEPVDGPLPPPPPFSPPPSRPAVPCEEELRLLRSRHRWGYMNGFGGVGGCTPDGVLPPPSAVPVAVGREAASAFRKLHGVHGAGMGGGQRVRGTREEGGSFFPDLKGSGSPSESGDVSLPQGSEVGSCGSSVAGDRFGLSDHGQGERDDEGGSPSECVSEFASEEEWRSACGGEGEGDSLFAASVLGE